MRSKRTQEEKRSRFDRLMDFKIKKAEEDMKVKQEALKLLKEILKK
jgi:hypothetical protein